MPNIIDILARALSLRQETALNSITPNRAGGIMYDTLLVLNQMQLEGGSLLISKVYASVSAMEADTTPTSDLTGRALKPGQLVVIVTSDSSSSDMGSEYRYNGPGSWTYVGKVGGLPLDTVPTQSSTKGITSGGVYAALSAMKAEGYKYMGIASPGSGGTAPGTPNQPVFYIAGPGSYPNFGSITVASGYLGFIKYSSGSWTVESVAVGKDYDEQISTLDGQISQLEAKVTGFAWTEGKYLNSSGNEVADAAWGYTDFIPYTQGNDVIWKWGNAGSVPSGRTINFYKADKTYISGGYWSVSGQTGQKTISAAGIASDAGQAAYIRASFKLGEDASITIGNSVAWKNSIGLESKVDANTAAIGVLEETVEENTVIVETNPIPVLDTLAEAYISNANGDLSTFRGYNTRVYDVEGLEKVLITLVKSTDLAAAKQYGFYSATSDFSASNALLVGDSMGSSMSSGTTEVAVPTGAKRLLLVVYSDTVTQSASSKETESVVEVVNALAQDIEDKTTITKIETLSPDSTVSGKYIKADGSLADYDGYVAEVFNVEGLEKVFITLSKVSGTASRQYAFYTSDTTFDASTAALVGPNSGSSSVVSGTTEVNVPDGAKTVMLINYPGAISQTASAPIKQGIKTVVLGLAATEERKMAVKFDGTDLLVAYLDGTTEYCYRFKKCLANDLFTFYLVGYRSVTRPLPSVEGIINEDGITAINRANSDNIGPISMYPGGYVGGNHLYNDTVKTAKTDTFTIFVDGEELSDNDSHYCNTVSVRVVNTLYDPSVAPGEGATILTTPLATETEEYKITENNIQVSVSIQFVNNAPGRISNYYGMQSMCVSETGVLTPNGALASAWSLPSSTSFTKGEYPKFNRFIEKKDTEYYQSTYLIPNKAGNHGQIEDTDPIFVRGSTAKDYHQIAIGGLVAGRRIVWSGVYTFMRSVIADDANILAYMGIVNGKKCLFVASKQSCTVDIAFPSSLLFAPLSVVEKEGNIETENTFVDVAGVHIDATGTGSLILEIS